MRGGELRYVVSVAMGIWWAAWVASAAPAAAQSPDPLAAYHAELGFLDYADELHRSAVRLEGAEDLGDGVQRIEITFELTNQTGALFDAAIGLPDVATTGVEVRRLVQGARFGPIGANAGSGPPLEPLIVDVATDDVGAFVAALSDPGTRFDVLADERPQLRAGVTVYAWSTGDDIAYESAKDFGLNTVADPFGDRPWDPTEKHGLSLYYPAVAPAEFLAFDAATDAMFLMLEPPESLDDIPRGFHFFAVDELVVQKTKGGGMMVGLTGRVAEQESLLAMYTHAGFSTGPAEQIDHPVGATRLPELDGVVLDEDLRDSFTVPIRFNGLELFDGEVQVSGQIHGHALKPIVTLRIRPGDSELTIGLETDVSLSAEVRATGTIDDTASVKLYGTCFPLPDLTFGPVSLPMSLHLDHHLFASAELRAGAAVGIQHRVQLGYQIRCSGDEDGHRCVTEQTHASDDGPIDVTPPQLASYAKANATLGTRVDLALWVGGSPYPLCLEDGARIGLSGELHAGLYADASADPWWGIGHGGSLDGSIAIEVFGFGAIEHDVELLAYHHDDDRLAMTPPPDPAALQRYLEGEDQRWMVGIDQHDVPNGRLDHVSAAVCRGAIIIAASEPGDHRLLQLDRFGELVWNTAYDPAGVRGPEALAALPDCGVVVAGSHAFVAVHEPTGEVRWARDLDFSDGVRTDLGITLHDVAVIELPGDDFELVIVGDLSRGVVSEADGFAARLSSEGDVIWSKIYDGPGRQTLYAVTVTANGDIVAVGDTDPDVYSRNALMVRIDGTDGALLWSRALMTRVRGGELRDVVEGEDGRLYAVGSASRDIRRSGSAFVARVEADGASAIHALLVHDLASEDVLDFDTSPPVQTSDGGFDTLQSIAAVGDGVVVAGYAGLSNDRTAWLARLGPKLGVEWFQVLDGDDSDTFHSVAASDDGLIVAGASESAFGKGSDDHVLVAKVPFEGGLHLHDAFDALTTRFLVPGLRNASGDLDIVPDGEPIVDAPLAVAELVLDGADAVGDVLLLSEPAPECVQLMTSTGHVTTTDPCEDADLRPPIVRILVDPARPYPLAGSLLLDVLLFDEDGVAMSEVTVDGVPSEPGSTVALSDLGLGIHTIEAWAEDAAGNRATDLVRFEVDDDASPEPTADTGRDSPVDPPSSGCGCRHGGAGGLGWGAALFLVLLRRRTMIPHRGSACTGGGGAGPRAGGPPA